MRARSSLALAAVLVAGCGDRDGARPGAIAGAQEIRGTVVRSAGDEIAIRGAGGRELILKLGPQTAIRVDGQMSGPAGLVEGAQVRAAYRGGDAPVAIRIEASSGAPPGAGGGAHGGQGGSPGGVSGPGDGAQPIRR